MPKKMIRFALNEDGGDQNPLSANPDVQLVTFLFKEPAWGSILYYLTSCSEEERQDAVLLFHRMILRIRGDHEDGEQIRDGIGIEMSEKNPIADGEFEKNRMGDEISECKYDIEPEESVTPIVDRVDVDQLIVKYFARFDLDGSGSLNSKDELDQLTTNLLFKLAQLNYPLTLKFDTGAAKGDTGAGTISLNYPPVSADSDLMIKSPAGAFEPRNLTIILADVEELNDEKSWTVEDYRVWFYENVWEDVEKSETESTSSEQ